MKRSEATLLVAKLAAAFPREWAFSPEATAEIYAEHLERLPRAAAANDAIEALIDSETRLPSIAAIRDEYRRYHDAYTPPALPEPPLTDEQRAENLARLRELGASIGRKAPDAS